MTTRVTFYDIAPEARFPLAAKLAVATWEKGKRMLVRTTPEEASALDQHLWTFRPEAFVPHEIGDDPGALTDPEVRVVIITRDVKTIAADVLLQLAPADLAFARGFDSVIDLVDHADEARLEASRARYKAWAEAGMKPDMKKA